MLYTKYKKYGRKLTQTEIAKNDSLPNPSSIFYYFQTTKISDVWREVLNEKKSVKIKQLNKSFKYIILRKPLIQV